jgi:hypothetical protein
MSPRPGPKDAEAVLCIVEGDALEKARQGWSAMPWLASCENLRVLCLGADVGNAGAESANYTAPISCLIR